MHCPVLIPGKFSDLIDTYKIINGIYNVKTELFFDYDQSGRRGHSKKLFKRRSKLDIRKFAFSNKIVDRWNSPGDFFEKAPLLSTRGHDYKLYKNRCYTVRSTFFSERIVNTWNILPADVDFSSLVSFVRTVRLVDLSVW